MGDWLGTGTISPKDREYLTFNQARIFSRSLNLKNGTEWKSYCRGEIKKLPKLPNDIPRKPDRVYKDSGWKGMSDWLGID